MSTQNRRKFLKHSSQAALGLGLLGFYNCSSDHEKKEQKEGEQHDDNHNKELFFKISLAQWSLHRTFENGELDNLDFAATAKNKFGIEAIEYVNQFFKDKANDKAYLGEMKKRAADNGVKSLIIMVDGEGDLGGLDDKKRAEAVANHEKWLAAAQFLGCHSIRVNAFGIGSREDVGQAAIDGLGKLAQMGAQYGQNVIVENHGGWSSDGDWLTNVMAQINLPNCGILPDFGNFCIEREGGKQWEGECINEYDRYKGVQQFMKYAKAVSAKSHDFNATGEETNTDFMKMMKIVKDGGYSGYVGVEYEGSELSEVDGILATKKLLETVGKKLS
jgi:sugar phosphate isomerase/epimerase